MKAKYSSYLSLITFFAGVFMLFPAKSKALNYADFKPGRIIDDVVFTNKSSMSLDQIQTFLNSKVPVCYANHPGFTQTLKRYTDAQGREVVNTARFDPPFTCARDYQEHPTQTYTVNYSYINTSGVTVNASVVKKVNNSHRLQSVTFEYFGGNPANGISKSISTYVGVGGGNITGAKTAAQIIFDAAQTYNINPQALIVTLEKETSLITDDWAAGWQYDRAMGWACPDTGIGQSANCDTSKEGFMNQVMGAGWQYRNDLNGIDTVGFWSPYGKGLNNILYNPNVSCGYRTVNIENQATAVLYKYTPYTPNDAAIYASPGVTVTCGAYGNRNFWRLFNIWFGPTYAFILNGVSYEPVFNSDFYLANNPDVATAFNNDPILAFNHFATSGMREGRQGSSSFNVMSYKNRYLDLRRMFGNDFASYYRHYVNYGKAEGRIATGDVFVAETILNGFNYDKIYNFSYYQNNNPDIKRVFGNDDISTLTHFVFIGMAEGRQASENFSVISYRARYYDLRRAFLNNLPLYYTHFAKYGAGEGRIATGNDLGGTDTLSNIKYSGVYSFDFYIKNNSDLSAVFGLDDEMSLRHFVNYGMSEGRQAISGFNVLQYKDKYTDLRSAFGNDLTRYFWHYMNYGLAEGRTSN